MGLRTQLKWFIVAASLLITAIGRADGYYQVLGIDAQSSTDDIKAAWKRAVKVNHPDHFADDETEQKRQTALLVEINDAKAVLTNSELRPLYDSITNFGEKHEVWAAIPSNRRTVDALKTNPPRPSRRSSFFSRDQVAELLCAASTKDDFWKDALAWYVGTSEGPLSAAHVGLFLKFIESNGAIPRKEQLATVIGYKAALGDPTLQTRLRELIDSRQVKLRTIGLTILKSSIQSETTDGVLGLTTEAAESILISRLEDANANVRLMAVGTLRAFPSLMARVLPKLREMTTDSSFKVAMIAQAVVASRGFEDTEDFLAFVRFLKKYKDNSEIGVETYNSIWTSDSSLPMVELKRLLYKDSLPPIRESLIEILHLPVRTLNERASQLLVRFYLRELELADLKLIQLNDRLVFDDQRSALEARLKEVTRLSAKSADDRSSTIKDLSSRDYRAQGSAMRALLAEPKLNSKDLDALGGALLKRQRDYEKNAYLNLPREMAQILDVMRGNSDLSPVAKKLRQFAKLTTIGELKSEVAEMLKDLKPARTTKPKSANTCSGIW